jgi:hypothetical protein
MGSQNDEASPSVNEEHICLALQVSRPFYHCECFQARTDTAHT